MRVLLLAHSLGVGGTERQIVTLAKGLHARGVDLSVAVFYADGLLERELHEWGVPVIDLSKSTRWGLVRFFIRLVGTVRTLSPQVIYSFLATPNILTVALKPLFPAIRMVWGVRSSVVDFSRYDWLFRLSYQLESRLSGFADLVICNSHAGLEYAANNGFPRSKMTVVPNGTDVERFKPDEEARLRVRREWGIRETEVLIGIVGRLDPMKDHHTFLRAAAMCARESDNVRYVAVGDGPAPYRAGLRQVATDLGLDARLLWVGERDDMPAVCNALDIAVSSSVGEGFSNVLIEAMACGVPCVATDVGDSALIVGTTGCVVPAGRPDALCKGLLKTLARLGPELRQQTRQSVLARFANDRMITDTLDALCRVT